MTGHRKTSNQAKSPSTPLKISSPRQLEPSNPRVTPSSNRLNGIPSNKRILSDSQSIKPSPNPLSPKRTPNQHSANSTPTRSETDRKSFQGDHHRHRYMSYSASPSSLRPSPHPNKSAVQRARPSPSPKADSISPRSPLKALPLQSSPPGTSPGLHPQQPSRLRNPTSQHLGAPINAHYSPHYGSSAQGAPTGKRKPPPRVSSIDELQTSPNDSHPAPHPLTPQTASPGSQHSPNRSAEPSPSQGHRKLIKSRSPSPSPRSGGLAKKIGSVLTAPFRSSNSRRGSDASEIGLAIQDVVKMDPSSFPISTAISSNHQESPSEHLPCMPSAGAIPEDLSSPCNQVPQNLTLAQQIIHETRSREAMTIVPESPERVLRVVNGNATASTKTSSIARRSLDGILIPSCDNTEPLSINKNHSRSSFPTSSVFCSKCVDLESQITDEVNRTRALERALEEQTNKLEQLRNWATAKVAALNHALQVQERILNQVEERLSEQTFKPDMKSDYLIALQKDFIELNARLAVLEGKSAGDDEADLSGRSRFRNQTFSTSQSSCETQDSPSTQPTSFGRMTPSSSVSQLREERPTHEPHSSTDSFQHREMCRAYSTSPLMMNNINSGKHTPEMVTPRKIATPWKPSSPANMASKLVPPTLSGSPRSPASHNCRSAPTTPNSRSPRPRYTSVLGFKAPSPLSFRSAGSHITQDRLGGNSQTIQALQSGCVSPTPTASSKAAVGTSSMTRYRKPFEVLSQTTGQGLSSSTTKLNPSWNTNKLIISPDSKFSNARDVPVGFSTPNFHSKRISVINHQNQNLNNFSPSNVHFTTTKPLAIGHVQKKPVVGDLIKMFDGPK